MSKSASLMKSDALSIFERDYKFINFRMTCLEFVLSSFSEARLFSCENVKLVGDSIPIPRIPKHIMISFLHLSIEAFAKRKQPLLYLNGPHHIVGDLHGSFHDLLRVLKDGEKSNINNFIFLGDYVDRGEFSIETVTLLFALAIKYPKRYIMLRGNHEFRCVNIKYGFRDSITRLYQDDIIWELFNRAFDFLPLAASIDHSIFCIHAGISKKITLISNIADVKLPITNFADNEIVEHLTWSDPSESISEDGCNNYERGYGVYYSKQRVLKFISDNGIKTIVKGHQRIDGVKHIFGQHLISVHTCDQYPISAGYITYDGNKINPKILPKEKFIPQKEAFYYDATTDEFPTPDKIQMPFRASSSAGEEKSGEVGKQAPFIKSLGSLPKLIRLLENHSFQVSIKSNWMGFI